MLTREKIFWIGAVLSCGWIYSDIPGSRLFALLFFCSFSLIYWGMGFQIFNDIKIRKSLKKISYENIPTSHLIIGQIAGWACSTLIIGLLFVIQNYPGGDNMLTIGIGFCLTLMAFSFGAFLVNKRSFFSRLLFKLVPFTIFGALIYLLGDSVLP